jgi:hypothetical protein
MAPFATTAGSGSAWVSSRARPPVAGLYKCYHCKKPFTVRMGTNRAPQVALVGGPLLDDGKEAGDDHHRRFGAMGPAFVEVAHHGHEDALRVHLPTDHLFPFNLSGVKVIFRLLLPPDRAGGPPLMVRTLLLLNQKKRSE